MKNLSFFGLIIGAVVLLLMGFVDILAGWWPHAKWLIGSGIILLIITGFVWLYRWTRRGLNRSHTLPFMVFLLFLTTGITVAPAMADQAYIPKGGTCWWLAGECTGDPTRWPELLSANPQLLPFRHKGRVIVLLWPRDTLNIPDHWPRIKRQPVSVMTVDLEKAIEGLKKATEGLERIETRLTTIRVVLCALLLCCFVWFALIIRDILSPLRFGKPAPTVIYPDGRVEINRR